MKHLNFSTKRPSGYGIISTTEAQWKQNGSTMKAKWLRFVSVLVLILTIGVGNVWGEEKNWNFSSDNLSSKTPISLTYGQGNASNNTTISSGTLRLYANRTGGNGSWIKFTAASGYEITAVSVTGGTNQTVARYGVDAANEGAAVSSSFSFSNNVATVSSLHASTFTIKNGQNSGSNNKTIQLASITITYASTASCDKKVTITQGTPETGGSFNLDKTGAQDCCSALTATISNITAPSGKRFKAITQSGINSGVTINQNAKTVTYAANTTGSSTINVTFEDIPSHNINFHINGGSCATSTVSVREGDTYSTMPTVTGLTTNCEYGKFEGWTAATSINNGAKPTMVESVTMEDDDVDLYAVYSKTTGGSGATVTITPSGISGTSDPYTVSHNQAAYTIQANKTSSGSTAPAWNGTGEDIRVYAKGTVVVSNSSSMTELVFNISAQGLKRLAPITASTGTIATQESGDETVTWTGSATSVTFTVGDKADYGSDGSSKAGQLCFSTITATTGGGGTTTYSLDANCCEPLGSINGSFFWTTPF